MNNESNIQNINTNVISRTDNLDEIENKLIKVQTISELQTENEKLTFLINKYNIVLNEYQAKYGNELFLQIDNAINSDGVLKTIDGMPLQLTDITNIKNKLIGSISLIKEYEAQLKYKEDINTKLKEELANKDYQMDKLDNKEELIKEIEKLKEEKEELYNKLLSNENILSNSIDNITTNKNKKTFENLKQLQSKSDENISDQFLNDIQQIKAEAENYKNAYSELKEQYDVISEEKNTLNEQYNQLFNENRILAEDLIQLQKQVGEKNDKIINQEKLNLKDKKIAEKLDAENTIYKKENKSLKEIFEEAQKRKNLEINSLSNTNTELKKNIKDLKNKNSNQNEQISNLKFEIAQLKQENSSLKFDRDHLTKILEDSNNAIQSATAKEKRVEELEKSYKKKYDEQTLEILKLNQKIKMQENQINKFTNDCANLVKERGRNYESLIATTKSKYDELIKNKNDEINVLKQEKVAIIMDKDKYYSDYKTLKMEYDKLNDKFHTENSKYISNYENSQKKLNENIDKYESENNKLKIKTDKLESDNKMLNDELKTLRESDKYKETQIIKFMKNENKYTEELNAIKDKLVSLTKENETLSNDNEKSRALYDAKLKNINEEHDIKVITLENSIKYLKDKLTLFESKAYDMLKKQENLTEKYKKEYSKTIQYYENMISNMGTQGQNTFNVNNNDNINNDNQMPISEYN